MNLCERFLKNYVRNNVFGIVMIKKIKKKKIKTIDFGIWNSFSYVVVLATIETKISIIDKANLITRSIKIENAYVCD